MNDLGFLIWLLSKMPPVQQVIDLLRSVNAKWVSIKIADKESKANTNGGNDQALLAFIGTLKDAGISVGGWHYIYPGRCGPQGGVASERVQKLGLDHLLIDAEVEWQKAGLGNDAMLYMNSLEISRKVDVGLCSFKFPTLHAPIPFGRFIKHERSTLVAPQVYWLENHDPVGELERSLSEHQAIAVKPFVPIGSAFGWTNPGTGKYWEPTPADLSAFVQRCKDRAFPAYGFYSLDWIIEHNRHDWLDALVTGPIVPPPPVPLPVTRVKVTARPFANLRSVPEINQATDAGDLMTGSVLPVDSTLGDWYHISGWVHKSVVETVK